MKIKCKPKEKEPLELPVTYNQFGRPYARIFRYGKWGRIFCVQCPHCEDRWELADFILRRRVECSICAVDLQLTSNYVVLKEEEA